MTDVAETVNRWADREEKFCLTTLEEQVSGYTKFLTVNDITINRHNFVAESSARVDAISEQRDCIAAVQAIRSVFTDHPHITEVYEKLRGHENKKVNLAAVLDEKARRDVLEAHWAVFTRDINDDITENLIDNLRSVEPTAAAVVTACFSPMDYGIYS